MHLVVDNYATHRRLCVQLWLRRHPRFHLHFPPTSCSGLNLATPKSLCRPSLAPAGPLGIKFLEEGNLKSKTRGRREGPTIRNYFERVIALLALWLPAAALFAAAPFGSPRLRSGQAAQGAGEQRPTTGKDLYEAACASCHGLDGKGADRATVEFDTPLPDFSDCSFASREPDADWSAITHEGGPVRGFSETMPSSSDALSSDEIQKIIDYIRGFCTERAWPRGELNLPRPLVTEKAFPEDETVLTTTVAAEGPGAVTHQLVYERRFAARNQIELAVPLALKRMDGRGWGGGVGDIALGFKRVVFHSLRTGSILSLVGETVLPTGEKSDGSGKGFTVFEPFVAFGQLLPSESFFQFQGGVEFPVGSHGAAKEAFWRTALGRSFTQGRFGRTWSPMVELLGARELVGGAKADWDLVPQFQVSLSTRQHILLNVGVRVPLNNAGPRPTRIMMYLLWDWFDGGLRDGW